MLADLNYINTYLERPTLFLGPIDDSYVCIVNGESNQIQVGFTGNRMLAVIISTDGTLMSKWAPTLLKAFEFFYA